MNLSYDMQLILKDLTFSVWADLGVFRQLAVMYIDVGKTIFVEIICWEGGGVTSVFEKPDLHVVEITTIFWSRCLLLLVWIFSIEKAVTLTNYIPRRYIMCKTNKNLYNYYICKASCNVVFCFLNLRIGYITFQLLPMPWYDSFLFLR